MTELIGWNQRGQELNDLGIKELRNSFIGGLNRQNTNNT